VCLDEGKNLSLRARSFFWVTILISLLFIAEALGKLFERGIRKTQDKRNRLLKTSFVFWATLLSVLDICC